MPAVTLFKLISSLSENFTVAPPFAVLACLATKLLPASKVTLLPEPTFASASEPVSVLPLVSTTKWFAFNASATVFALTNLPSSAVAGALTVPSAFTKSPVIKFGVNVTFVPSFFTESAVGFADSISCTAVFALSFTDLIASWMVLSPVSPTLLKVNRPEGSDLFGSSLSNSVSPPIACCTVLATSYNIPALTAVRSPYFTGPPTKLPIWPPLISMPLLLKAGPRLPTVKPSLFNTTCSAVVVSPNVTESAVKSLFNANFTFVGSVASLVAVILLSPSTVWSAVAALANFAFASLPRDNL